MTALRRLLRLGSMVIKRASPFWRSAIARLEHVGQWLARNADRIAIPSVRAERCFTGPLVDAVLSYGGIELALLQHGAAILSSHENPKICGIDDAEVVGDLIAVDMPIPRHLLA